MQDVFIYGAGGLGRAVHDILRQGARYRPVGFLDSNASLHQRRIDGLRVLGGRTFLGELAARESVSVVVAVGDNRARVQLAEEFVEQGCNLVSAIHPLASLSPTAWIAQHVIIGARATICVHARIGPHAVISTGAIVEHDNHIGRGAFLHPAVRLAGGVQVSEYAMLGIGACVIPGRRIGRCAWVEPGAVVIRDVPDATTAAGVPAAVVSGTSSRFRPAMPLSGAVPDTLSAAPRG